MKVADPSLRTRLTLWHAGVLAVVICVFSVGIFVFVRVRLYQTLDQQIRDDVAAIERVYREEVGDLGELDHRMGITRFQVKEGSRVVYETSGWPPGAGARLGAFADASHRITAARDETSVRQTLKTLGLILIIGV